MSLTGLDTFLAASPVKKLSKDEILVCQDEKPQRAFIVKTGLIKCYDISQDGSQQLITLIGEGEIFPLSFLLNIEEKVQFFYGAFTDSEIYTVNKAELRAYLRAHPDILFELFVKISCKLSDLHYRVNAVEKPRAREKILHTLAFIADRFKRHHKAGKRVELSLPLTHQDIADLVGLTRETTAATLKNLKDEGFIDYDKKRFFVFREKIQKALW